MNFYLINETLYNGNDAGKNCVKSKNNVIDLNWNVLCVMFFKVHLLKKEKKASLEAFTRKKGTWKLAISFYLDAYLNDFIEIYTTVIATVQRKSDNI